MTFRQELEHLINKHSMENESNTPDWILATFLMSCLNTFNCAVNERTKWYGDPHHNPEEQGESLKK